MKNYELVLMLKVSITEAERKAVISEIESKYKVLDKDEIGIKDLYYTVKGGIRQAYFVMNQCRIIKQRFLQISNIIC